MVTTMWICILIYPIVVGVLVAKCIQLGLRWQMETKEARPPTMDSPIKPIIDNMERKEEKKQVELSQNVFDEWVNGAAKE